MARYLRVEFPGAIYHVTVRMLGDGVRSRQLFRDKGDHLHFLKRLGERVETYGVRLYAHCEMLTHYHLLIETPQANLGRFMHSLNTAYTLCYNLRHHRSGPLVQGRYGAKLVDGDTYMLSLSRYIHLNPVCIKGMKEKALADQRQHLHFYPWSSYRAYIGRTRPPEWLNPMPILAECGRTRTEQHKGYRDFVEGSIGERDDELLDALHGTWPGIGGEAFQDWVKALYTERLDACRKKEDVRLRHETSVMEPEVVLVTTADVLGVEPSEFRERRRNSMLRAVAAQMLVKYAGLLQREAATVLGMRSGAALGQQQRKLRDALPKDRNLRKLINRIEIRLNAESE